MIAIVELRRRDNGFQVTRRSAGAHNAEPLGRSSETILLKTDAAGRRDRRARAHRPGAAGAKWEKVVPPASELGLAAPTARPPTSASPATPSAAASAGMPASSGSRANSVTAIEVVTADGEIRASTRERGRPLLGDARRRGNSGIVTALEMQLYPIPEVYAGALFFPWERRVRGPARVAGVGGDRPGVGHLRRPGHAVPALRGGPGAAPRAGSSRSSRPSTSATSAEGAA